MTLDARDKAIVLAVWQQWAEHGYCNWRHIEEATGKAQSLVRYRVYGGQVRTDYSPGLTHSYWWQRRRPGLKDRWVDVGEQRRSKTAANSLRPGPLVGGVLVNKRTGERTLLRRIEG